MSHIRSRCTYVNCLVAEKKINIYILLLLKIDDIFIVSSSRKEYTFSTVKELQMNIAPLQAFARQIITL